MKNFRKIIAAVCTVVCAFSLAGCKSSPEEVKIASEREIRNYAKKNYGSASGYEVTEGENERTVTFTDKEYGFTYYVRSYASAVGIDGSTLGYTENKVSDFYGRYYDALYALAEEEFIDRYDIAYGYVISDGTYECHVYNVSADDAETVTREIGKYLDKLDTRNYFSDTDSCVKAYAGEKENYIGAYHISDGKYYYYADEKIEQMKAIAESEINSAAEKKKTITYLYWEQMDISEVPGLEDWELVYNTMDDGTVVTLYWFDIDGEKHFFADVKVWNLFDEYYSDTLVDKRN